MNALIKPPAKAHAKQHAPIKQADTVRVFFALWPQAAIQRQLHVIAREYQIKCDARVMRPETLHMTLQFIGNIKRSQLPALIAAADKMPKLPPFRLELNTLSFWKHNRIGYATLSTTEPALETLAATLQHELATLGFVADYAKFSPHLTLLRNVEHILASQNFMPITWQVNSFVLVESVTINQKTQYRILQEWSFANLRT